MSAIPTAARTKVHQRERFLCIRCRGWGAEIHHRQRRRTGGHGLENLILLCKRDHDWAHSHPAQAKAEGLIVSSFTNNIEEVPIQTWHGEVRLTKQGTYEQRKSG
jgi:hypothetical protein